MLIEENDERLGGVSYQSSVFFNNSMSPSVSFCYTMSVLLWLCHAITYIAAAFHVTESPQSEMSSIRFHARTIKGTGSPLTVTKQ